MSSLDNFKQIVMVTSLPKSGTHLMSKMLENLGLNNSRCFAASPDIVIKEIADKFGSHRHSSYFMMEGYPHVYQNKIDIQLDSFMKMLDHGDFFLSHFAPKVIPHHQLANLKIIFVKRNIIKTLISGFKAELLIIRKNRNKSFLSNNKIGFIGTLPKEIKDMNQQEKLQDKFYCYLKNVAPLRRGHFLDLLYWQYYKNVFFADFENITTVEKAVPCLLEMAKFLEINLDSEQAVEIVNKSLRSENPTKLPEKWREQTEELVWDEKCQRIYENYMLDKIQRKFDLLTDW